MVHATVQALIGNCSTNPAWLFYGAVFTCWWMQTVALQSQAAAEATVFAVRQDEAADEPTHSRVIEHTEQLVGAASTACFVPGSQSTHVCPMQVASSGKYPGLRAWGCNWQGRRRQC
jgi:hypothetical protein